MVGFYCATPYHIFVALHMSCTQYKEERKTILIMEHFSDSARVVEELKKSGLFENVFFLRKRKNKFVNDIERLGKSFFIDSQVRKFASYKYDEVIFFALDFINYAHIIRLCGNDVRWSYGEDGIGTYSKEIYNPSKIARCILKIRGIEKNLLKVNDLYVFRPDMMYKGCRFNLKKLDSVTQENVLFKNIVDKIWDYEKWNARYRVLYIEQPYAEVFGEGFNRREKELYDLIEECSMGNVLLRMHPRSKDKFLDKNRDEGREPLEVRMLKENMDDKIIISTFSTACMTPKILYDYEPILVFLYKLFPEFSEGYENGEMIENLIENIRGEYYEKWKVIVPTDLDELRKVLDKIRNGEL